jgi:hypothetical protein
LQLFKYLPKSKPTQVQGETLVNKSQFKCHTSNEIQTILKLPRILNLSGAGQKKRKKIKFYKKPIDNYFRLD